MKHPFNTIIILFAILFTVVTNSEAQSKPRKQVIKGIEVSYISNGVTCKGYVAYDASLKAERPGILVVPEWWGCNEYVRMRARMLAKLGYIAFAVDIYGEGMIAKDPKQAGEYATAFYSNPALAFERLQAALQKLKEYPETNIGKIAAIGYCFGGSMVLNAAKSGMDLKGVVSFHGSLPGLPATANSTKADLLICHGGADQFISKEDIKKFKENLDSMNVHYSFITYPNATHAFTNVDATAIGLKFDMPIKYNAEGDKKSWNDMKAFLKKIFSR